MSNFAKAGLRSEVGLGDPSPCPLPQILLQGYCNYLFMRNPGVCLMDFQVEDAHGGHEKDSRLGGPTSRSTTGSTIGLDACLGTHCFGFSTASAQLG
jgi:hypothetical protein